MNNQSEEGEFSMRSGSLLCLSDAIGVYSAGV